MAGYNTPDLTSIDNITPELNSNDLAHPKYQKVRIMIRETLNVDPATKAYLTGKDWPKVGLMKSSKKIESEEDFTPRVVQLHPVKQVNMSPWSEPHHIILLLFKIVSLTVHFV